MSASKGWPDKAKPTKPERARLEESLKVYARVVRSEAPPAEREEFTLPESERLKTIS